MTESMISRRVLMRYSLSKSTAHSQRLLKICSITSYKGTIDINAAKEVLAVAEMCEVVELKELCEDLLSDQMSLGNIYDIFQLSYDKNAERLKQNAKAFVHDNYAALCRDPEFRTLIEEIQPNARTSFFFAAPKPPLPSSP